MRHMLRILLGALYRPYDLLDDFKSDKTTVWVALGLAASMIAGSAAIALSIIYLALSDIPAEPTRTIMSLPLLSVIMSTIPFMTTGPQLKLGQAAAYSFWFVIAQTTITPSLMIGLALVSAWSLSADGQLTLMQIVLLILLVSVCFGKLINLMILLHQRDSWSIDRRWLVVIGLPALALVLWMTPPAYGTLWLALALVLCAVAWAQLRLGAWLWQAGWALLLMSVAGVIRRSDWPGKYFPACLDQTRFLPLPRTMALLRQQRRISAYQTARWIRRLATQPNDRWLVQRFVLDLPPDPTSSAILFWLSIDPVGQKLLASIPESRRQRSASVQAYTKLSHVVIPGAWRVALERYASALISAPMPADLGWVPDLIQCAQLILEARRWESLHQRLVPQSISHSSQTIEERLDAFRVQIRQILQAQLEIAPDTTWPIRLLDAATEHLAFLKEIA
jgi:hypothetical protein